MFRNLKNRIAERVRLRRDIRRLAELDDRLLADVGVLRAEIADAVRGRC